MWETVDTTNDSWAYAWYDNYWKTPKEILHRLVATVGRGGTYMLNIGPRGDGTVPARAARALRAAGQWIKRYPQVVYGTGPSPWGHAMPWGDATVKDKRLYLVIFDWPNSGALYLPGLKTPIASARLLKPGGTQNITFRNTQGWTVFDVPAAAPEPLASVLEVTLKGKPQADTTHGVDPQGETQILALFAEVTGAQKNKKRWMEKFGEWKHVYRVSDWKTDGKATWQVDVLKPGDYNVSLSYAGEGRVVWGVDVQGGQHIQNQQNSSHNYQKFPIGWIHFPKPGRYTLSASCLEGDLKQASLKAIHLEPAMLD